MTYFDAFYDKSKDKVLVVGRNPNTDDRFFNELKPDHTFYYADPKGTYDGIDGEKLKKVECTNSKSFYLEQKKLAGRKLYENDIKPVYKTLEKYYLGAKLPNLHLAPLDIETGFDEKRGFAPPDDPHQPITAITVNLDWKDQLITLVLKPDTLSVQEANDISDRFENSFVFTCEKEMLKTFFEIIEDVDVLYTWNGEGFDIPYIVNRTIKILGKDFTRNLCFWDEFPRKRDFERYGKSQETYDLVGRLHLDYFLLYKKYTYHELPSYRLDFVGEVELNERKVQYDGTLDQLYKNDFQKFIEYNRQDVLLLTKLERKLKFINLTNILAHENCITFNVTLGSVGLTDQAIILEAHRRNMLVPARLQKEEYNIAGAYVADPKKGLAEWVASIDINSLYPSVIRSLNMSPETLFGQIKHTLTDNKLKTGNLENSEDDEEESTADKWSGLFSCLEYDEVMNKSNVLLDVLVEETQEEIQLTGKEIHDWIFSKDSNLVLSTNGTLFRKDKDGLIPGLLTRWYAERKEFQKKAKELEKLSLEEKDSIKKKQYYQDFEYWDSRQQIRKINLNALYGAITNIGSRFCDSRIGQSTTLSGRTITKHMCSQVAKILTGEYSHLNQTVIYSDTDSCYFSIGCIKEQFKESGIDIDRDNFVEIANDVAVQTNESFPEFVSNAFNVTPENANLIKCGRELCIERALFIKKKHYAALYYDKDGNRIDLLNNSVGKLYIKGLATQRADTPEAIQKFLKEVLMLVLTGKNEQETVEYIKNFRDTVKALQPWEKGTPKKVNNLSSYRERMKKGKVAVPGHVRASLNWNNLRKEHADNNSMPISDGQKVIVCDLKPNNITKLKSVARPIDEFNIPKWFKELPFDNAIMEKKLIDTKLENIIGVLNYDLDMSKLSKEFTDIFEFED